MEKPTEYLPSAAVSLMRNSAVQISPSGTIAGEYPSVIVLPETESSFVRLLLIKSPYCLKPINSSAVSSYVISCKRRPLISMLPETDILISTVSPGFPKTSSMVNSISPLIVSPVSAMALSGMHCISIISAKTHKAIFF